MALLSQLTTKMKHSWPQSLIPWLCYEHEEGSQIDDPLRSFGPKYEEFPGKETTTKARESSRVTGRAWRTADIPHSLTHSSSRVKNKDSSTWTSRLSWNASGRGSPCCSLTKTTAAEIRIIYKNTRVSGTKWAFFSSFFCLVITSHSMSYLHDGVCYRNVSSTEISSLMFLSVILHFATKTKSCKNQWINQLAAKLICNDSEQNRQADNSVVPA